LHILLVILISYLIIIDLEPIKNTFVYSVFILVSFNTTLLTVVFSAYIEIFPHVYLCLFTIHVTR